MGRLTCTWLLLALTSATIAPTGTALQCWSCSSDTDLDCGEPFNSAHKVMRECDLEQRGHKPICTTVVLKANSLEKITMRGCDWAPVDGPLNLTCHVDLPPHSSLELCHVCMEDGCNKATKQGTTYLTLSISMLVLFLNNLWQHRL